MTENELKALDFIRDRIGASGVSPTLDEIGAHLGLRAKGNVHRIVSNLVRQGALRRDNKRVRGIRIVGARSLAAVPTERLVAELRRRGVAQ